MHELEYNYQTFNNLPSIGDAASRVRQSGGDEFVMSTFRDLFTRYDMDRTFGLVLLHSHFSLSPGEKLVEYSGTSVPWKYDGLAEHVRPTNWIVTTETITPYEFNYSMDKRNSCLDLGNSSQLAFLKEFAEVQCKEELQGLFGICRYPGDDFKGRVEITQGRSNINLAFQDYPSDLNVPMSNAAWFFSPPLVNFRCTCPCSYTNNAHNGEHRGHHEST